MKTLNLIRRIITYPIRLIFLPFWAIVGFLVTDWEDKNEVDYFKRMMEVFYKI